MRESKKSYSSTKTSRLFEKAKRVQQSCKEMFKKKEQTVLETTTRIQNDVISTLNQYMELKKCHEEHLVEKELDDQKIFELEEQKNKLKLELSMQKTSKCEIQERHSEVIKFHEMTCEQSQKELATRDTDKLNLQEKLRQIESEKNSKEEKLKKQTLK